MKAHKKLTLNDRVFIQTGIESNTSFTCIAKQLNVSTSTISREVKNHIVAKDTYGYGGVKNRCVNRKTCDKSAICRGCKVKCAKRKCRLCRKVPCNTVCKDYAEDTCELLSKPPYVCNGCNTKQRCPLRKKYYYALEADNKASLLRKESRSGFNLSEEELKEIDGLLSDRIKLGQSIHHIFATSKDEMPICERQAYVLIKQGMLSAIPLDMPRVVRMKPRKRKSKELKVDKKCRVNRTYEDYLKYMEEHNDEPILEGDTVEGTKGGKCILTLSWPSWSFQIGILRDHNNSSSVTKIVDDFYNLLGDKVFHKVFPSIWLLDNGSEFSNPMAIEKYGIKVFYCNPSSPYQKGFCENNHEHIRKVLPKGTSFDDLDQEFFDLLFSHINSLVRKKLNDQTPFDLFSLILKDNSILSSAFNIEKIAADKVELKPSLLQKYKSLIKK